MKTETSQVSLHDASQGICAILPKGGQGGKQSGPFTMTRVNEVSKRWKLSMIFTRAKDPRE